MKMKQYADNLAEAGEPITDDSLCLYILGGLGQDFEATVVHLANRTDPLTLQDVQFSLHNQEMRIQQLSSTNLDNVQANVANLSLRG